MPPMRAQDLSGQLYTLMQKKREVQIRDMIQKLGSLNVNVKAVEGGKYELRCTFDTVKFGTELYTLEEIEEAYELAQNRFVIAIVNHT